MVIYFSQTLVCTQRELILKDKNTNQCVSLHTGYSKSIFLHGSGLFQINTYLILQLSSIFSVLNKISYTYSRSSHSKVNTVILVAKPQEKPTLSKCRAKYPFAQKKKK